MTAESSSVNLSTDSETRMILDSLDEFIEQEVRPIEDELGDLYENPRRRNQENGRLAEEVLEAIQTIRRRSAKAGFYAMVMPSEHGGDDVSNVTWYRAKKRVAQHGLGLSEYVLKGPEGPNPMLLRAEGSQVEKYLEPLVRAEKSAAFAQTEPGTGSDSPSIKTRAEKDGDDWVLNGHKQWITNAPYCDFAQVLARTSPPDEAGRYRGITCFLVDRDEFELGGYNNAVGLEGIQGEIILDDVRVPSDRVLGSVGEAFYAAMDFLTAGRMEIGAEAVGLSDFLLDECIEYAQNREAFGQPIGKFQQISSKIARGRAHNYGADSAGLKAAWKLDEGMDVVEDVSVFHWLATQAFWEIADGAVQVHGGNGLSEDNPFMEHLHYARVLRVVEGTDEIQLNTIARRNGLL